MSQDKIDALKVSNEKAEGIFTAANKGRDDPDPVYYQDSFLFKDIPTTMSQKAGGPEDRSPSPRTIMVTRYSIAVLGSVIQFNIGKHERNRLWNES